MSVAFLEAAARAATRRSSGAGSPGLWRGVAVMGAFPARGSVVTLHGVVHGRIQCAPRRARPLAGQELAGLVGERGRALARVAEATRALDQRGQARPLPGRPALAPG